MKTKVKNSIMLLLLLLLILMICTFVLSKERIVAKSNLKYINDEDSMKEDVMTPQKVYLVIAEYEGKVPTRSIYKAMYHIATEVFPKYYKEVKNLDDQGLEKYFEKNEEIIYMEAGIKKKEDFTNLINTLKQLNGETLQFSTYRFDERTINKKTDNVTADLYITYQNNEEIKFSAKIQNKIYENRTPVILKAAIQ